LQNSPNRNQRPTTEIPTGDHSTSLCDRLQCNNHEKYQVFGAKTPSPQRKSAQKVVKKYRRYAKNAEYRRLRTIVPSLVNKSDVSKVSPLKKQI
jgi:hypothetical protein